MSILLALRRKLVGLTAVAAATCFSHGSCSSGTSSFLRNPVDYMEEVIYEETYYYDDYYYDDCRCDDDGFDFWLDWF